MASKKKESEGIALLSMYNDEDDEMEDVEEPEEEEEEEEEEDGELHQQQRHEEGGEEDYGVRVAEEESVANSDRMIISDSANDSTPPVADENLTPDKLNFGSSTPQPPQAVVSSSPMLLQAGQLDNSGRRRGTLAIVDYGHDEAAMSPEAEDGEIEESGRVTFGDELLGTNGDFDRTSPGTVRVSTPNNLATPQISESPHSGSMNNMILESETAKVEETVEEEKKDIDPLDKFLPPPPKEKCSEELQRKINKFLEYKKAGKSFNAEVRNRKDYRNPDFLLHAVRYQDIDQIGSCFSKDVFDPHGYDKSDYYTEIEADMKREMERKELERKKSPKMEFVSGGTQPGGTVVTAPKINIPFSGVSAIAGSGLHSAAPVSDAIPRDGRQNKKSKWDKVDGDRRNPVISGGSDATNAHAALLSAANVGSGYMAFAQQRRREAEEKRSSERKLDRRS